jgi:acyl-homoserine lactone acylase PvdQ
LSIDNNQIDNSISYLINILEQFDFSTFKRAIKDIKSPSLNFIYADVNNNIAYQATGIFPKRRIGHTGM